MYIDVLGIISLININIFDKILCDIGQHKEFDTEFV